MQHKVRTAYRSVNLNRRHHLEDLDVNVKIIFKWALNKDVRVWVGLIRLRTLFNGELL
jgi:hypothetical protein